jgi:calcineurin-like phosphoesterase family protein
MQIISPPLPNISTEHPDFLHEYYAAWLSQTIVKGEQGPSRVASSKNANKILAGKSARLESLPKWKELEHALNTTPERVWVWSDLHVFHTNIIGYTGRPFPDADSMNEAFLLAANALVGKDDWLIFVGDVSFGSPEQTRYWLSRCPGRKALVLGNHDIAKQFKITQWLDSYNFEAVAECIELRLASPKAAFHGKTIERLWLGHYPIWDTWVPQDVLNVHGHTHNEIFQGARLNVSVECINFKPQRLADLITHGYPAPEEGSVRRFNTTS